MGPFPPTLRGAGWKKKPQTSLYSLMGGKAQRTRWVSSSMAFLGDVIWLGRLTLNHRHMKMLSG